MARIPAYKKIPISEAEIDFEYSGYKDKSSSTCEHICACTYKGDGIVWPFDNPDRAVTDVYELSRPYTLEEQEEWYKDRFDAYTSNTSQNLFGLFHDMYDVGDARHEMYNAWIRLNFYEMAECMKDEDFIILGVAPAPYGDGYFEDPVAIVAEEYTGDRFWCHSEKKWVEEMREQMRPVYKELIDYSIDRR